MTLQLTGPALGLFLLSIILLTFSWITMGLRIWVRTSIRSMGLDDYMMVAGLIFYTAACVSTVAGSLNGVGSPPEMITDYYDKQGRMWFMFFQLFYVLSTVPIKASICIALLRITNQKVYHYIIYAVIILSTIAAVVTDIAVLAWCKPVSATWDPSLGSCADPSLITNVSYYISATSILTDWTTAILPAVILWDVQLHTRVKVPVMILLGFGFVASTATLVRLRYLLAYNATEAYLLNIAHIAIWSITESGLGLVAGSMATLRPLLKYLPWLGSMSSSSGGATTKSGKSRQPGATSHRMQSLAHRSENATFHTVVQGGDNDCWERLSDNESQKHIMGVTSHTGGHMKGITVTTDVVLQESTSDDPSLAPAKP
ncbi:unnamed protein product [Clonostachys rosea]|uniref:Rhodopsin domain-containing protein n=1 Tax=Bionectria ochroleuca TaxID=29856 RepID=A0ABY6UGX7_BIOOC|nr:unnamed protein product [Clonostachys rosea]